LFLVAMHRARQVRLRKKPTRLSRRLCERNSLGIG
jgi:hypothetical protein